MSNKYYSLKYVDKDHSIFKKKVDVRRVLLSEYYIQQCNHCGFGRPKRYWYKHLHKKLDKKFIYDISETYHQAIYFAFFSNGELKVIQCSEGDYFDGHTWYEEIDKDLHKMLQHDIDYETAFEALML